MRKSKSGKESTLTNFTLDAPARYMPDESRLSETERGRLLAQFIGQPETVVRCFDRSFRKDASNRARNTSHAKRDSA